ncbi:hypothetical protein MMC11_001952 [Xylographa trunciseda]|nr:hypothetical protein [Xylographa trunciseda]
MPEPSDSKKSASFRPTKVAETLYPATPSELESHQALHQAIDLATPDRIRLVLKELLDNHAEIATSWLTDLLMTNDEEIEQEQKSHIRKVYHKTSSDEENSDEENSDENSDEENSDEVDSDGGNESESEGESTNSMGEHTSKGLNDKISKNKPQPPRNVRPRYFVCKNCEEEFDVLENRKNACRYHPAQVTWRVGFTGILQVDWDSDTWADHDENCHGPIDTDENKEEYPEGFMWECCEEEGTAGGCMIGWHKDKARTKTEAYLGNKRKRRKWE